MATLRPTRSTRISFTAQAAAKYRDYDAITGQVENITPMPVRDASYRADRTQPIMFSPLDPHVLYYAAMFCSRPPTADNSWQTISPDLTRPQSRNSSQPGKHGRQECRCRQTARRRSIRWRASFKNANTLWAGTDDGLVWMTRDGGKNWKNITPPATDALEQSDADLELRTSTTMSAYVSVSRFRVDDLHPYIYRTHDGGKTWKLITNGLAGDGPVDTVREDPVRKGLLFAGSENASGFRSMMAITGNRCN